jgi:hypothetical protein
MKKKSKEDILRCLCATWIPQNKNRIGHIVQNTNDVTSEINITCPSSRISIVFFSPAFWAYKIAMSVRADPRYGSAITLERKEIESSNFA